MKRIIMCCLVSLSAFCSYAQLTSKDLQLEGPVCFVSCNYYRVYESPDGYIYDDKNCNYEAAASFGYPFSLSPLYDGGNSFYFDLWGKIKFCRTGRIEYIYIYKDRKLSKIISGEEIIVGKNTGGTFLWLKYDTEGNITDLYQRGNHYKYVSENGKTIIYEVEDDEYKETARISGNKMSVRLGGTNIDVPYPAEPLKTNIFKNEFEYYNGSRGTYVETINDVPFITYLQGTANPRIKNIYSISTLSRVKEPDYRGFVEYDEHGSVIRVDGDEEIGRYIYEYVYDSYGNWTQVTRFTMTGIPRYAIKRTIRYY